MDNSKLRVEWVNGNQKWMVVGGYLPPYAAWDEADTRAEALAKAHEIAVDMELEVQS